MPNTKRSRIATLYLLLVILLILAPSVTVHALAVEPTGLIPSEEERVKYTTTAVISELPRTYEVTVKLPSDYSKAYAICSSACDPTLPAFSLWINADGHPVITVYSGVYENTVLKSETVFEEIDLRTGEWEHLSIVFDDRLSESRCYVGGELKSTKNVSIPSSIVIKAPILIGGSYSRASFFKGAILDVALFSDTRTDDEIANDAFTVPSGDNMLCYYDFSEFDNSSPPSTVQDLSPRQNSLALYSEFYDAPTVPLNDYAYSFAIIGDIQTITCNASDKLHYIFDWIEENKEEKNIAFAFNLGDFTEYDTDKEWQAAADAVHSLDGVVPYSIVRGNHDKSTDKYSQYFDYADHEYMLDGSLDGTMMNTYQTFTVFGNKYLVLNLDLQINRRILYWANEVVEQHPDYNVIVTTHIYLNNDGTTLDSGDAGSPEKYGSIFDAEELWDKFISRHKNITMVISGHISTSGIITAQRTGVHGNTVTQILVDPQYEDLYYKGRVGLVAMLYFSEDGKYVQTQYYSTVKDKYFLPTNEYDITLDSIQSGSTIEPAHDLSSKYSFNETFHWQECVCGKNQNEEEHSYGEWTVTKKASIGTPGYRFKECICGYRYS